MLEDAAGIRRMWYRPHRIAPNSRTALRAGSAPVPPEQVPPNPEYNSEAAAWDLVSHVQSQW